MSVLQSAIVAALTGQAFTVAGAAVTAYGPTTLPSAAESATLPCRIISPYQQTTPLERRLTLGGNRQIDWQITDLLLVKDLALGTGPVDVAAALFTYQQEYAAFWQTLHGAGGATWWATSCRMTAGVFEWPEQSGRQYDGVRVALTVREILSN